MFDFLYCFPIILVTLFSLGVVYWSVIEIREEAELFRGD